MIEPKPADEAAMIRASVLVPVYNSASTLRRCLESALSQTLANIEILVADDASTDDSAAIADSVARADARVQVIRLPANGGKPHAMNRLTAQARGEFLAVLDADDTYLPQRLETLIAAAEAHGVDMAADNLFYVDAGVTAPSDGPAAFGAVLRTAFDPASPVRIIGKADLIADANSYGDFDYGILKPVVRKSFLQTHGLAYYEASRLAEDFTYLMTYLVAGGRAVLCAEPLYCWTMPFGTLSRQWTQTGAGAWRYNYREALAANGHFLAEMRARNEEGVVRMLQRRGRQYHAMIHYIDAQRQAAEGRYASAALTLGAHPSTWRLLALRLAGRAVRALRGKLARPAGEHARLAAG